MDIFNSLNMYEGTILLFIQNNLRTAWLTPVMYAITSLGNYGLFWIVLTLILIIFPKTRKAGIISAIALVLSLIADNIILKNLFARPRPYDVIDSLVLIGKHYTDYSFPSGHTGSAFASAYAIFLNIRNKKIGIGALIIASLIALSRLYIGVHYPTDVIGGIAVGILVAFLSNTIYNKILHK